MSLMAGDRVTPGGFDHAAHIAPVAPFAFRVALDVLVVMALVKAVAAGDFVAILGGNAGAKAERPVILDIAEGHEHAIDQAKVMAVLETDDLFVAPLRIGKRKARSGLHLAIEPEPCVVAPANHLPAAQHLLGANRTARHFPDMRIMRAGGNLNPLPRHGGKADDRTFLCLAVDFRHHDIGRCHGESAGALDWRQLTGIAQHQDRLAKGQQVGGHFLTDHGHLVQHEQ